MSQTGMSSSTKRIILWSVALFIGAYLTKYAHSLFFVPLLVAIWLDPGEGEELFVNRFKDYRKNWLRVVATVCLLLFISNRSYSEYSLWSHNKMVSEFPEPTIQILSSKEDLGPVKEYTLVLSVQNADILTINGKDLDEVSGSISRQIPLEDLETKIEISAKNEFKSTEESLTISREETGSEKDTRLKEEQLAEERRIETEKAVQEQMKQIEAEANNTALKIQRLLPSSYEVSVFDVNGNFAKSGSPEPLEVIVNIGPGKVSSCTSAKEKLKSVLSSVYSSYSLKGRISRVKVTAFGYLNASLGSSDVYGSGGQGPDWSNGPTLIWNVLQQINSSNGEYGALENRTYGQALGGC